MSRGIGWLVEAASGTALAHLEGQERDAEREGVMVMVVASESEESRRAPEAWLRAKLRAYSHHVDPQAVVSLVREARGTLTMPARTSFDNPFTLDDLAVLDDETLRHALATHASPRSSDDLVAAFSGASPSLLSRVTTALPEPDRKRLDATYGFPVSPRCMEDARRRLLDALFWELTYWKTPELYEALTEGERIHPALFPSLAPILRGRTILDAGAGSGRATLECLRQAAHRVYAVEPSPGLLRLLERKLAGRRDVERVWALQGRFEALPLGDDSVDTAISCSAFTASPDQGGEAGLAELRRVTRAGGKIVIIWPRPEDYGWLAAQGFRYVALPVPERMSVRFHSLAEALGVVRRFYTRNRPALRYLLRTRRPEIPFQLLGDNPPHDYCWLTVKK